MMILSLNYDDLKEDEDGHDADDVRPLVLE